MQPEGQGHAPAVDVTIQCMSITGAEVPCPPPWHATHPTGCLPPPSPLLLGTEPRPHAVWPYGGPSTPAAVWTPLPLWSSGGQPRPLCTLGPTPASSCAWGRSLVSLSGRPSSATEWNRLPASLGVAAMLLWVSGFVRLRVLLQWTLGRVSICRYI